MKSRAIIRAEKSQLVREVVLFEDLLYPNAEFLFEVNGLGGPMAPYRYYAVRDVDIDQVADFYLDRLSDFDVELDAVEEGCRHLMLTRTESVLEQLGEVDDPTELPARGRALDGTLMGVEVVLASDDTSISRLRIARHGYDRADDIPADSVMIVLEYFKNVYG
jgi:hypothetical protein